MNTKTTESGTSVRFDGLVIDLMQFSNKGIQFWKEIEQIVQIFWSPMNDFYNTNTHMHSYSPHH